MRMWMLSPKCLCRKHLLGEHGEIHKFRHTFVKGHSIAGRKGQIEPSAMQTRHDELAAEMLCRGFQHTSPYTLPDLSHYDLTGFVVDRQKSAKDLSFRCGFCKNRMELLMNAIQMAELRVDLELSIEHWERMIACVVHKDFPCSMEDKVNSSIMLELASEDWYGDFCALCIRHSTPHPDDPCDAGGYLCPLGPHACCTEWREVAGARTWAEWLGAAKFMLKRLEKELENVK